MYVCIHKYIYIYICIYNLFSNLLKLNACIVPNLPPYSHYEMSRVHSSLHSCLRGIGIWCSRFSCHTAFVHLPVDLEKTDLDSQQTSQLPFIIISYGQILNRAV